MSVEELAKIMWAYYSALLAQGFQPTQALQIAVAYQAATIQNDLLERLNKHNKPWEGE